MDAFKWIEKNLPLRVCNSTEFLYDEMESQSDYGLPFIYQPFDPSQRGHWADRGSLFDFLHATNGEWKKLLDFGPGDGWPSLIVAPFAGEVIGVDGSRKRVEVCAQNAARLGISNARFLHVEPGSRLPFAAESFDGVLAASSVEQTPDPLATLRELFRVLRPGGRLRLSFEGLHQYRNTAEQAADFDAVDEHSCRLTIYDRHIDEEYAAMYRLWFKIPLQEAMQLFPWEGEQVMWKAVQVSHLREMCKQVSEAQVCRLIHPSGETFLRWLKEIGFREASSTYSGAGFASQLFPYISDDCRPPTMDAVDALLSPIVKVVVEMVSPTRYANGWDALITAVK